MNCIFCKIINGQIPSNKLYEDDKIIAFHDIEPATPVHFLVIPKEHIESMDSVNSGNSAVISHIFEIIAKLAGELKLETGYRVISNCGTDAGQTVEHLHFHVMAGKRLKPLG